MTGVRFLSWRDEGTIWGPRAGQPPSIAIRKRDVPIPLAKMAEELGAIGQ